MNAKTKTADCGLLKAKPIKVISVLVTLLCMAFAMTITANAAGTFSYYVLEDDTVKIVSYAGDDTTVTIPASLSSGKKVSMIVNTFNGNSTVKEVIVSDGVATIGENTFANCESLEYVTILSNAIAIDSTAFDNSAAVINCYSGSSAEAYAIENNISYQILPESVTLGKISLTLGVGETYTVKTQIAPSNASAVMTWTSSNKSIATVDSNGKITAVKAGTATIKATLANGKTSSCSLTVKKMSTSVSLNKTNLTLGIGESYDINSSVPSGTYAYYRNYTNSDSSVVSLDSQAVVTAKKAGTSTITCTLSNGKKAACTVTVKEMATKVTLNKTSITLGIGETYDLNSSVGSGAASYYRTYASSNTSVATVKEAGGLITAKKPAQLQLPASLLTELRQPVP
ncbi:MAG: Ig-like domain-containing protein [Clostridiales bacterium]|nr:Ig-like domain-containing protein [Clostridiales bacterium]